MMIAIIFGAFATSFLIGLPIYISVALSIFPVVAFRAVDKFIPVVECARSLLNNDEEEATLIKGHQQRMTELKEEHQYVATELAQKIENIKKL